MNALRDLINQQYTRARIWVKSFYSFPDHTTDEMLSENLFVLFGSQSGTAEDVAERVAREGMKVGMKPFVSSMNQFGIENLQEKCVETKSIVIFIGATTGQGDTPDNMKDFWKSLCKKQLKSDVFNGMSFSVIGLGDSSYEKYNFVGKKLFRRLKQLGAQPILDLCLGDDQHDLGYHAALGPWLERLWTIISNEFITVPTTTDASELYCTPNLFNPYPSHTNVPSSTDGEPLSKFLENDQDLLDVPPNLSLKIADDDGINVCRMEIRKVVGNVRVTSASHWQDTRLITIDLTDSALNFSPGDVVTTQPSNLPENVEKFFEIFPDLVTAPPIYLQKNPKMPWSRISQEILIIMGPQPWSWQKIVTHLLDIQSVPRLYFFELLSNFADNDLEKEKLAEFCTPQGQEDLFSYCNRPKRNILEVLQDFHHTAKCIPPIFLFDLIPAIKPRSFSIASSQKHAPNQVQILVAVVEYQTQIKAKRRGLCSNWLAYHCPQDTTIPIWIQKGSFIFPPPDDDTSIIMIGPGTGVAPFRSFITDNLSYYDKWLFFGCRNEELDFYFGDEWKHHEDMELLKFRCAFSRDSQGLKRDYVQDKLMEEESILAPIMASKKFFIYVAGNSKQMPKDVHEAIVKILCKTGNIEDPELFLEQCSKSRLPRYQTETWA